MYTPPDTSLLTRSACVAALIATLSGTAAAAPNTAPAEPELQSYSIDFEAKVSSDRRTNGLSDTYRRPGAELSMTAVHESGLLAYLQLGTVAKENFPDGDRTTAVASLGYRWGNPSAWHFGTGVAQEMFPHAQVKDAPIDPFNGSIETATTKFNTTYGVFEFGYGIFEARYLLVMSRDFRGMNTSVVCGSAVQIAEAQGDPTYA